MRSRVIDFIACTTYREEADRWLAGHLSPEVQAAFTRHFRICASCKSWLANWQPYFTFMQDVGRDVTAPHPLRDRIRQRIQSRRPVLQPGRWLRWCLQPVQVAVLTFLLVFTTSLFLQQSPTTTDVSPLGHVMRVEAQVPTPQHRRIEYRWWPKHLATQQSFQVVLECFDRGMFSLYDPQNAENPWLAELRHNPWHRGFFQAWCRLIPGGSGWVLCQPDRGCELDLELVW